MKAFKWFNVNQITMQMLLDILPELGLHLSIDTMDEYAVAYVPVEIVNPVLDILNSHDLLPTSVSIGQY